MSTRNTSVQGVSLASAATFSPSGVCSATQPRPLHSLRKTPPLLTVARMCTSKTSPRCTYWSAWQSACAFCESVWRSGSESAGSSAWMGSCDATTVNATGRNPSASATCECSIAGRRVERSGSMTEFKLSAVSGS